eukprot:SAG22_NODE_1181_length_5234_cov_12.279455_5_plen_56_part_00
MTWTWAVCACVCAETTDLWAAQRADAKAMLGRFIGWQASVEHSKGPDEIGCQQEE